MVKDLSFSVFILVFCITSLFSQNSDEKEHKSGFGFSSNGLYLFPYNDEIFNEPKTDFDLMEKTAIYGMNGEFNYHFSPFFGLGLGLGYEKITQPDFSYFPVYINLLSSFEDADDSITTHASFGIHAGKVDQTGFLFRWGLGYRVGLQKLLFANFKLLYSYQNMYKSFENSGRIDAYYNLESLGLSVGFEIK